jgi:hypothetical protein
MATKKTQPQKLSDKRAEVESQLIANAKDAAFAKRLIAKLIDTQKQIDNKGFEIQVPTSTVTETVDFSTVKIQRSAQGYLFTAKGGFQTLVSWNMQRVCLMIQTLIELHNTEYEDTEEAQERKKLNEIFINSVLYVLQAPIFASLNSVAVMKIATSILKTFNEEANEMIETAEPSEETEEDVKANIEADRATKAFEQLVDEAQNLPNYDE